MAVQMNRKGCPTAENLRRLLRKGESEGVAVIADPVVNDTGWYMVRGSRGATYHVCIAPGDPMHGCDCEGFEGYGHCKHYAIALDYHGWLPEDDDPDPDPDPPEPPAMAARGPITRRQAAADLAARFGMQTGAQWAGAAA